MNRRARFFALALALPLAFGGCGPWGPEEEVFTPSSIPEDELRDYAFDLQRECFCTEEFRTPVRITVRNRVVTEVRDLNSGTPLKDLAGWPSIEEIYRQIDAAVAVGDEVAIEYDTAGYPTVIRIGSLAADAGVVYRIGSFTRP